MTTQTTYSEHIRPPVPGVIAGNLDSAKVNSRICETAEPGIGFGLAVGQGALSDGGAVLGGALAHLVGVSVRDITLRGDVALADVDHYQAPNNMAVLEEGDIWVAPGAAVVANGDVFYNTVSGVFMAAAGSNIVGPVPGWRYKTSCGVGGAAILEATAGKKATGNA